ncbi:hypothetical protein [Paenibacillus radicis (ex Xue et al. 2023)]|uniref:YfhO family protein n=1 Tax=Paenibacillus radicis (ex Xue et al. 2023) TaxID=2972489 RepID=A0ABT1YS33_9BACL|nr:hypothetical protein [Paenibacillus radicis (ex Xue et al. 2023)]MCR8635980.1 hypothetical protein [Paenibacillus radicis (ex Xue et al. 2023)]
MNWKNKWIYTVILIHIVIALTYSGTTFLKNMNDSIPASPVGNNISYMTPGDHFEQFYRYSIVKNNILRMNFPYFSGYQYNFEDIGNFTEGLVFFPFSFISGMLSFVTGDILAYNLMALLSYVFVGLSAYYLVLNITKNKGSAIISSVFYSALPFRTSFLYGEMVYGIDLCLLPLPILFTEKAIESNKKRYFLLLVISLFLISTANSQMFYYYSLLVSPYFVFRFWNYLNNKKLITKDKLMNISIIIFGICMISSYLFYILKLMSKSALEKGQDFSELFIYSPEIKNIFIHYSGNEKNLYIGWTLLIFIVFIISGVWNSKKYLKERELLFLWFFIPIFLLSYILTFGPNFDKYTGLNMYKWFFDNIPAANGTRTTGRIMAISALLFTVILGIIINFSYNYLSRTKVGNKFVIKLLVIIVCFSIILDFNYLNPIMVKVEKENSVYRTISGTKNRVLAIPFQHEADHFMNASYMYYSLIYDLRMFNGHSSLYPSKYREIAPILYPINEGEFTKEIWRNVKNQGFKYIIVHNTEFEPRVSRLITAKLINNKYLNLVKQDKGYFLLEILDTPKEAVETFQSIFNQYINIGSESSDFGSIHYFNNWYAKEVYADQRPFRWTKSNKSSLVYLVDKKKPISAMEFDVKAPLAGTILKLRVNENQYTEQPIGNGEWHHITIKLAEQDKPYFFVELEINNTFNPGKTDSRELGIMVSDIIVK